MGGSGGVRNGQATLLMSAATAAAHCQCMHVCARRCARLRRQCQSGPLVIPASQWEAELTAPNVPTASGSRYCPDVHCVTLVEPGAPGAPGTTVCLRFDYDAYRMRVRDGRAHLAAHQYNDAAGGVVAVAADWRQFCQILRQIT